MRFSTLTLGLLATSTSTLALANPAPANVAALAAREAQPAHALGHAPEIDARAAGLVLETRKSKTPNTGSKNNTDNAAGVITPSRALELGALGLGVLEVVRLWG
jgi:hypothetical protein